MRLLFGPLRPAIGNWDEVARALLERARREASADRDPARRRVIEECVQAAPAEWRTPWPDAPSSLVLTVDIRVGDVEVRLFTTISTLGTAQDITLQELHIESFHPADAATERLLRAMAS